MLAVDTRRIEFIPESSLLQIIINIGPKRSFYLTDNVFELF